MPQLYTGIQNVTAETMGPMNHLRAIKPEVREGVSRFSFRFIVMVIFILLLFIHGADQDSSQDTFFILNDNLLMVINYTIQVCSILL